MEEPARQRARELANTPEFARAQRHRKKVEALFAELKNQIGYVAIVWNTLVLAERNAEVQNIDPELRRLFTDLVGRVGAPVMSKFRDRVEELRDFTKERASRVNKTELANLCEDKKKEIISEYIDSELKNADELLQSDRQIRQAFEGKEDQLHRLKEYHFGPTTVELIRQRLPKMIDELESRLT